MAWGISPGAVRRIQESSELSRGLYAVLAVG